MYNIVNIVDYILSGKILENNEIEKFFDIIIFEDDKYFLEEFKNRKYSFKIYFLNDLNYDFGLSGILQNFAEKNKKVLIVLNKLNSFYLLPFINSFGKRENVFILNLNVGVVSKINKFLPEKNDVGLFLDFGYDIFEPFDLLNLFEIFKQKGGYIRVSNKDYALNIFEDGQRQIEDLIINFIDWGITGDKGTILSFGYMLPQVLQAVEVLNGDGLFFDLFGVGKYNFKFTDEIIDSLRKTEKLIVIADTYSLGFVNYIKTQLYEINMPEVLVDFILPDYNKIKTTLIDYIFEDAKFDYLNIADRIKKIFI